MHSKQRLENESRLQAVCNFGSSKSRTWQNKVDPTRSTPQVPRSTCLPRSWPRLFQGCAYLCIPVQDSMLERFGEVCFWSKKWRDQKFALVFFRSKPWCWALSWELWEDPVAINGAQGEKMKKNEKLSLMPISWGYHPPTTPARCDWGYLFQSWYWSC